MTIPELTKVLLDAETALGIQAVGKFNRQTKNVREGRALKRKIAIISTLIRQKELNNGK